MGATPIRASIVFCRVYIEVIMELKFSLPSKNKELSEKAWAARVFGALSSRLVTEERTGTVHPDGRNENVAEHSLMLVKVAIALGELHYPTLDSGKIAIFASLHDDVEAYVGDTPTDIISGHDPKEKKEREAAGLEQLCRDFAAINPRYVERVKEYEQQQTPEARFVRVVDKIMVELIHFPNEGAALQGYYTKEVAEESARQSEARLLNEYPEYADMIAVKLELAKFLRSQYLR